MPKAEVENEQGWKLQSLNLYTHSWVKDGKYTGKMTFMNKVEESLTFNIPDDKMAALLALVADSVVDSAKRLGDRMANSIQESVRNQTPQLEAPIIQELQSEPVGKPASEEELGF